MTAHDRDVPTTSSAGRRAVGPGRRRRHRLRAHRRRRARRRPVARRHARGGAGLLHPALRRARVRGRAARAAGHGRRAAPDEATRVGQAGRATRSPSPTPSATSPRSTPGSTRWTGASRSSARQRRAERAAEARGVARRARSRSSPRPRSSPQGNDWRNGANRLRDLLDEWKALPRLESADDALWRRFSTARTTYTRRRKAHFAELNEKRDGARVVKERLVKEAEALADSTEWGPTAGKYRDLMRQWKAAGPAPRGRRRRAVEAVPRRPGHLLRRPRRGQRRAGRGVRRQRREEGGAPRRGRGAASRSPTSRPPRRPSATSPSAGTPPARSRATG